MDRVRLISVVALVVMAGCAGPATVDDTQSDTHYVHVYEGEIANDSITVEPGDTVMWVVHSGNHSLKANSGEWSSGKLTEGDRYKRTFAKEGTHTYHCHMHSHKEGGGDATVMVVDE